MANIYIEEIIPLIRSCQNGDELLFISPSTFFGYYSLGAHNFEEMCDFLKEAKERGVKIKLIVNVFEPFSAQAGRALSRILVDYDEIRDYPNTSYYFIIRLNNENRAESSYREFTSKGRRAAPMKYLDNNIKYLPFSGVSGRRDNFVDADDELNKVINQFQQFWDTAKAVKHNIRKYNVYYHKRKLLIIEVLFGYVAIFVTGILLGICAVLHSFGIGLRETSIGKRFLFPLFIGIFGGVISRFLGEYIIGRIKDRFSKE